MFGGNVCFEGRIGGSRVIAFRTFVRTILVNHFLVFL